MHHVELLSHKKKRTHTPTRDYFLSLHQRTPYICVELLSDYFLSLYQRAPYKCVCILSIRKIQWLNARNPQLEKTMNVQRVVNRAAVKTKIKNGTKQKP